MAQEAESLARPAGSGFTFTAPHTMPGADKTAIELPASGPVPLSLDDAISLGLERNVQLRYNVQKQRIVKGEELGVINALLPSLRASASTSAEELNLAALGFRPQSLAGIASQFGLNPSAIPTIVKVDVTQALLSADQELFNLPDFEVYKGAKREAKVVDLDVLTSRGEVVLAVASAYLKVLADETNLTNAQAQERAAKVLFDQAVDRRNAGIATNLDALRGQVEYQQRQQASIAAETQLAKDTIQLDRIMGLPAGQPLELTDAAPFTQLADMNLDRAKATAYVHRKDLLSLQAQIDVADRELRAIRYQRLPTLAFNGFYGVVGETHGLYHGSFTAEGSLRFPIFREAGQRGEEEQAHAQLTALRQRESDLRVAIDAQIRSSTLDVKAADQLVKVAQSNVDLAQQELADERDRFAAGVDDNLPVVDAQATVAGAQAQLVQALYQYNLAKLQLARNTGIIESHYRTYLGK
ncbi:MAG TPA: TolC family protein [Acidobacteriaceae bacterium]|nr:TolC family protein [Acidobacteriaceae bacterium]